MEKKSNFDYKFLHFLRTSQNKNVKYLFTRTQMIIISTLSNLPKSL